jgi:hypothetical protein
MTVDVHLDPDRLAIVRNKAQKLRSVYQADLARFVGFLTELLSVA